MAKNNLLYDLVVVGGGAAGFFCAVNAAERNPDLRIAIVERSSKLLSKVLVSGGGRCNLTHGGLELSELILQYPRGQKFLKKAFHHFGPGDTIQWFESRGVPLKTEADGRMFPQSNRSQSVVDCLMQYANKHAIDIFLNASVSALDVMDNVWTVSAADGRTWQAVNVCITCGGFNKLSQYDWLFRLGLEIVPPAPSLFTFNIADKSLNALMGVSVPDGRARIVDCKWISSGPILVTHWGLSGPAILRLSALGARYLAEQQYDFSVVINWLGNHTEESLRTVWTDIRNREGNGLLSHHHPFNLPSRLWLYLLVKSGIGEHTRWSELKAAQQNRLIQVLTADLYSVRGKTTFKEEFVTCGGVALSEVDVNTMQCKKYPGLHFAGEILDIDGVTGGYNFQNAWTTGWIAARHIAAG